MKLYLSSYRIPAPDELAAMLPKSFTECRTAIIPNAQDYQLPNIRAQKLDDLYIDLSKFGIKADIIDLREFDDSELVKKTLETYDFIWIAGGNTFVLRYEMRRSGFDQIVKELLQGEIVYGGESAGAIVAGVTLKGFEVGDDPYLADELIWDGLHLVDKIIAPHMDNPDFVEYSNHIKKVYLGDPRVVYMNDNQVLIVNDNVDKVVTGSY